MKGIIVDKLGRRTLRGYVIVFLLLAFTYILTSYTNSQLNKQSFLVDHTNKVIDRLNVTYSTLKDDEAQFRGYLILRDEQLLNGYRSNSSKIYGALQDLRLLALDNLEQEARLDTLNLLITQRLSYISNELDFFNSHNQLISDSITTLISKGRVLSGTINNLITRMKLSETELLEGRRKQVSSFANSVQITNTIFLFVAIALVVYSIITFNKENRAKLIADQRSSIFRKQLEERVEQLNTANKELVELRNSEKFAAIGRVSSTLAHEIKNPLTNIKIAASQLSSGSSLNKNQQETLWEMITRNCTLINKLISDLLHSTSTSELKFEPVRVNELLDETLHLAADRMQLKKIALIKNYAPDVKVSVDVEKIKIAFLNLIINAVEAMNPDTGVLTITTKVKGSKCDILIKDNGKGMSRSELSKLFEPFYTTKKNGTGLGLTNTHNIILSHNASIIAESEQGKGTFFTVTMNTV